jgi:hypothetical protein
MSPSPDSTKTLQPQTTQDATLIYGAIAVAITFAVVEAQSSLSRKNVKFIQNLKNHENTVNSYPIFNIIFRIFSRYYL